MSEYQVKKAIESGFYRDLYQKLMKFKDKELTRVILKQIIQEIIRTCEKYESFKRDEYVVRSMLEKIFGTLDYVCAFDICEITANICCPKE